MELVVEVVSTEKHLMGQNARYVFLPAGGVIGRSSECDWVIPDQTRHLSGRHAIVSYESGQFFVTDISTNGIYMSGAGELSKNRATPVNDGDRLQMGEIQFQLQVNVDVSPDAQHSSAVKPARPMFGAGVGVGRGAETGNPMDQVAQWAAAQDLADKQEVAQDWQRHGVSMADNVSPEKLPFEPPRVQAVSVHGSKPGPKPGHEHGQHESGDEQSSGLPDGWWLQPESHVPSSKTQSHDIQNHDALAAFAEGLGVSSTDVVEAGGTELLRRGGQLLRRALFGMVSASQTRALMKNEFRLDRTLVNTQDNNPLKLSANGEQAIKHFLREEAGTFMSMNRAVAECFEDVQEHQLAMMAGMQGALLDLLDTLSPQVLEQRFEKSRSGLAIGSRSARLWDAYCELHGELLAEDQLFTSLFAEPFAKSYDEQMMKLKKNRKNEGNSDDSRG